MKKLCGIDEAGRGPIAGPLVMAGVILNKKIKGLNDSKKLSQKKRNLLYKEIREKATFHVVFMSNKYIDEHGISKALQDGLKALMKNLNAKKYLFDGNTTFGIDGLDCKIKADETVPQVSAASIVAKVTRDEYMKHISNKFPQYAFEKHKGYGTKAHIEAIKEHGYCELHRMTFKVKGLNKD